jgi:hypothetical protein
MRTMTATLLGCLLGVGTAQAGGVQLFNTDIFGERTSQPVKLLLDRQPGEATPYVIWADVSCDTYVAGSVFYRSPVRVSDVVAAVDALYATFKLSSGPVWLWRVTDKGFAIQVVDEKEEEAVRVTYLSFANGPCANEPAPQK